MADVAVPLQPKQYPTGSARMVLLSKPKEFQSIWIRNIEQPIKWGNQEPLWPVLASARNANASPRVLTLAYPKKNFQTGDKVNRPEFMFSAGRSSMIWEVSPWALKGETSERVTYLARAKEAPEQFQPDRPHYVFSCGRASPIWKVSNAAKRSAERPHTNDLARPKSTHPDFVGNRQVETIIPRSALSAGATPRLDDLARPKERPEGPFREPQWPVPPPAKKAVPTPRCQELSKPKPLAEGYQPNREVLWPVSRAAKRAIVGQRLNELAIPIIRATMDHVQFDPDAFLVSQNALKARCSKRTEELAVPTAR